MILLEGFLVRLTIGITKISSRRIINVTLMTKTKDEASVRESPSQDK